MKRYISFVFITIMFSMMMTINIYAVDEEESNDSMDQATQISVNSTVYGDLSKASDVDWYKFTISQDGYFTVEFTHDALESSNKYWILHLYDSTGANYIDGITSGYSVAGNKNVTTNTFGVKAGTYYIKIYTDYYHSGVPYKIKINFKEASNWETENNNSRDAADKIKVGTEYNGALTTRNDVDWYEFTVASKCDIAVSFSHAILNESRIYWNVYIYDSESSKLMNFSSQGNIASKTSEYVSLSRGTYYIKIQGDNYSGINYSFVVMERHDCTGSWKVAKAASCEEEGQREQICDLCGKAFGSEAIPATGHKYGDWVVDREPSCSVEGEKHAKCTICGAKKTESIATVAHNFTDWKVVIAASCEENGQREQICDICGEVLGRETISATGHNYGDWEVDRQPSCSGEGEKHARCTICGAKKTESIATLAHSFIDWKVVEEPTCYSIGKSQGTCSECGAFITKDIAKLTHEYTEWSTVKAATCIVDGIEVRECKYCALSESRTVEAYTHQYGEWEVIGGNKIIPPIIKSRKRDVNCVTIRRCIKTGAIHG